LPSLATPRTLKLAHLDAAVDYDVAGNYQVARDRVISVGPFSEVGNLPVFFDSKTRRFGVLYPISGTERVNGTLRDHDVLAPADVHATFQRNQQGEVTGLVWREGNARPLKGIRVSPHQNEEVVFQNGDVTLHGTLTLPEGSGAHPAVVLLQEAGPRSRPFGFWPYLFARYGIAMLTFDKRGSGASTGHWESASFDDLAGDALAAVRLLRSRSEIDSTRIGLWGNSNSGWVVPIVASQSKDVAFVISRVGSSLPPTENVLYEIENQMHGQGFSEAEIAHAIALRRLLQNAIITNTGWESFTAAARTARDERWFAASRVGRYAATTLPPDAVTLQQWRNPLNFDPRPYWERVTCPVLAIYGALDKSTPTARDIPILVAALNRAGNNDYTIIVLPKTDHQFYEYEAAHEGYVSAIPALQKYVPGYVDGMIGWLSKRLKLSS
jgi:pimeloyl-ACP methyl ester carboxylesterase